MDNSHEIFLEKTTSAEPGSSSKKGNLETEGLIMTAKEQALRTDAIKTKVEQVRTNSKCHLCNESY